MKKIATIALLFALAIGVTTAAVAQDLTGKEIIDKIRVQESYEDTMIKMKMTLENKRGETRERLLVNRVKKIDGLTRTMTTFLKPDDVKGTKFLTIENKGRDDDQFLFLPALDKVRRISSNQKGSSFMGSDFSFGDLEGRDPDKGVHKKIGEETRDGFDCYIVESTPVEGDEDDQYSKSVLWVRKDIFVPVRVEFYDKSGELLKVLSASDFQKTDDIWLAHHSVMENVQKNHKTIIDIAGLENNQGLDDDYFSQRFLKDKTQL